MGNVSWWKLESSNLHLTFSEVHHQHLQSRKGQHHSVLYTGKRANSLGFGNVRHTEMFKEKFSNELTLFQRLGTTISQSCPPTFNAYDQMLEGISGVLRTISVKVVITEMMLPPASSSPQDESTRQPLATSTRNLKENKGFI